MLKRTLVAVMTLGALASSPLLAQDTKPETLQPGELQALTRKPPMFGQPLNIKVDFTITDQSAGAQATKRTVSMILADQQRGSIRNRGSVFMEGKGRFDVFLVIDATPIVMPDRTIRLTLSLEYSPKPDAENAGTGEGRAQLNQQLSLILVPGKALTISRASDPTSNRNITVDVLATILT
jgi:hypothetical protein